MGIEVPIEHVAVRAQRLAVAKLTLGDEVAELELGLLGVVGHRDVVPEELRNGRGRSAQHRGLGRRQLEQSAGAHRGGAGDRVDVQEDLVGVVGRQHLLVGQAAGDIRLEAAGKAVPLVLHLHARIDVQVVFGARRLQQELHLFAAFRVLLGEIGAGEGHIVGTLGAGVIPAQRVVNAGLRRERQQIDAVVSKIASVVGDASGVDGEHRVEERGRLDEPLVVGRILLVPEDGGDALLAAPGHQLP